MYTFCLYMIMIQFSLCWICLWFIIVGFNAYVDLSFYIPNFYVWAMPSSFKLDLTNLLFFIHTLYFYTLFSLWNILSSHSWYHCLYLPSGFGSDISSFRKPSLISSATIFLCSQFPLFLLSFPPILFSSKLLLI